MAILDYLRSTKVSKSTDDIRHHLLTGDYFDESCIDVEGREKQQTLKDSAIKRAVQRDMNFLYGATHVLKDDVYNDFGLEVERGPGKSLHWKLDPYSSLSYDFEKMPSYLALSFAMTQKHLSGIMPRNTLRELERFFQNADTKLQKEESSISKQQYLRLKDSVEFYQRGQTLKAAHFEIDVLDTIYRAILKTKQLHFSYRDKKYRVHPFGVVILLPKLYLIAKKDQDISTPDAYRSFLIHKISDIEVLTASSQIPDSFSLKSYIDKGNMDVYVDGQDKQLYQLELLLNEVSAKNLLEDLKENPISEDQELRLISNSQYKLTASVKRTVQLKNWIMGLGRIATVIAPEVIRNDIFNELSALLDNYTNI